MLYEILSDLVKIENVLFIVKSNGAVSEIRSNMLNIRQKEKWINIGENDGPCHMHVNSELIKKAEFVKEQKPERISFSVRFYDESDERVLAAFITKMYDDEMNIIPERLKSYEGLFEKYGSKDVILFA
jgi:putative heme iron utilization protein